MATTTFLLLVERAFDSETCRPMGVAFERACETLGLSDKTDAATLLSAEKVIDAARTGERNAEKLYEIALESVRRPPRRPRRRGNAA